MSNVATLHEHKTPSTPPERLQTPEWLRYLARGNLSGHLFCSREARETLPSRAQMRDATENHVKTLREFTKPADPKAMAVLLKRLSLHYHMPPMTEST